MGKRRIIDKLSNSNYLRPALAGGLVIMLFFGAMPINQNALAEETDFLLCDNLLFCTPGELFSLAQFEFIDAHPPFCEVGHYHGFFGAFVISQHGEIMDEPFEECGFLDDLSLYGTFITLDTCTPGEVCRPAAGVCDRFEECGSDGFCPADLFLEPNDVTSPCAVDQNECTTDPVCDGSGPSCPSEFVADVGKVCGPGDSCTTDMCDANAVCQTGIPKTEGEMCGNQDNTQCDNPNTCDGDGNCQDNHEAFGEFCVGSEIPSPLNCAASAACDGGACIDQFKDEFSSCGIPIIIPGICDALDTCDAAGTCVDRKAFFGTACGNGLDSECTDPDSCDASGNCRDNHVPGGFPFGTSCGTELCKNETCQDGVCKFNVNEPNDTVCKDSLEPACTEDDTCQAGVCVVGGPVDCSDGNICTADLCFPGPGPGSGCFNGFPANPLPAVCQPNVCVTLNCNDGNACTADSCDPVTGCVNTAIMCDDSNQCTADSCNPASGCVFTPTTAMCNDMDSCTSNDKCDLTGECVGDSVPACLIIDSGDTPTDDFTLSYKCEDENTVTLTDVTYTEDGNVLSPSGMSFSCPDDVTVPLPITGTPNDFSAHVNINGIEGDCNIECVEPNDCDDLIAISFDLNEGEVVCFRGEGSAAILILSPPTSVAVGGTFIPIDSAALLVAYTQNNLAWIIPLLMITAAIGFMKFGRSKSNENSI